MMRDVDVAEMDVSDELLDRFLRSEFAKLDVDRSGRLDLEEFSHYVTGMACFMRDELLAPKELQVGQIAARAAVESSTELCVLPPPRHTNAHGQLVSVVEAKRFGVFIEVPSGALPTARASRSPRAPRNGPRRCVSRLARPAASLPSLR